MENELNDKFEIYEFMAMRDHIVDDQNPSRKNEVFTVDAVLDRSAFGLPNYEGIDALIAGPNAAATFCHMTTNCVIVKLGAGTARTVSKLLVVTEAEKIHAGVAVDDLVRTPEGWRIKYRRLAPRQSGIPQSFM